MPQKPVFVKKALLRAVFSAFGIITLWFFAHYLKNLYLGNLVSYQEHFTATTKVNFILLIATICTLRCIWKEFAFTLVELAIVLIIIGFVIAGISGGISLVQSAKLNAVISEVREKQTAVLNFRSRFNALPGDFNGAFAIWGTTCGDSSIGGTNSCSGNSSGIIDSFVSNLNNGPVEDLKFWQHLSLAGMLSGSFSGQIVTGRRQVININVPGTAYSSAGGYWPRSFPGGGHYNYPSTINAFEFGSFNSGGTYANSIIMPMEAYSIDQKIDDGVPNTGKVATIRGANFTGQNVCATGDWNATGAVSYILTDTTNSCRMNFFYIDNN